MTIGGGIALAAIGAILTFAVQFAIAGFDIRIAGVILMLAGLAVVIFGLIQNQRRVVRTTERPATEVRRERVVERDPDVY
jgi:sulfite exporter TauE/SafE